MLKMAKTVYEVICYAPDQRFNKARIQSMQYVL